MRTSVRGGATRLSSLAPLLLGVLVFVSGCLTVDATLNADGSATIDMTYPMQAGTKADVEKARLQSEFVKLESFEELKQNRARAKVKVTDVTKLSTAAVFKDVTVTITKEGADSVLKVLITKPRPVTVKNEGQAGPVFTFTLPGKVVKANRDAKIDGNKVTWNLPFIAYVGEKETDLVVTYASGDAAAAKPDADKAKPAE